MQKRNVMATIAVAPIIAPILALLASRTFVSGVIAFVVNWLVIHDPSIAPFANAIQTILLVMWLALAGKFSIEYLADTWANRPGSADQAQIDIVNELSKTLKALIDALLTQGLPPAPAQTVTVNTGNAQSEVGVG